MTKETKVFKTEVKQLLDLMIHSLYSNPDIFLRELISNASDAIDKLRFESLTNQALVETNTGWAIRIDANKKDNTLIITDNGIGMNQSEIETNIGTIAQSGTREFINHLKSDDIKNHPELIGQFGVGFYSSFMVADKITIKSRKAGEPIENGVVWESSGDGNYTIDLVPKDTQGTEIILHLKSDQEGYLEEYKIREIVRKYSSFVEHPIQMDIEREETEKDEAGEEIKDAKKKKVITTETLNSQKALWTRPKADITPEEYKEFYHHVSHHFDDPLEIIHFSMEGTSEFKSVLFIPEKSPWNMFMPEQKHNVHLYVKRIFIMDDCKHLVPEYMRFLTGVVDSNDLPLNVSREILQQDGNIRKIEKNVVKKVLGALTSMKDKEHDKYLKFYKEFGKMLKEGIHSDFENKDKIKELVIYESTFTDSGKFTSLKEYVDRMPKDQKEIYYITGESRENVEHSPHLEAFREKGYEVLFMTDPIDEWVMQSMKDFNSKNFKPINQGNVDLNTDDEKKEKEKVKKEKETTYKDVLDALKDLLKEEVKDVILSSRLTESACCLVADQHDMTPNMERIMQSFNQEAPKSKRILELNPLHPILETMKKMFSADKTNSKLKDYAELLYGQALITEGSQIKDPVKFTKLVSQLMVS